MLRRKDLQKLSTSGAYCLPPISSASVDHTFQMQTLQVVSAAKYIMRKESTRDHVDLLLSSKHWPVVFAVDMACDVVAHVEVRHPNLATALWEDRRGCFQKPHPRNDPQVCCSYTCT